MLQDKNGKTTISGGIAIASFCLVVAVFGMWGCPRYSVYRARKEGEAQLAHAVSAKEVAVAEAKAKWEAAPMLAAADTLRAQGIAASNRIIGQSLKDNPSYLQWLFIEQLKDTKDQVIYIPSGMMGMPIMEANRLNKPEIKTE